MAGIPEPKALSEALEPHFTGRRVKSAVFLTYTFEPDFFELYILPLLLPDLQLSPAEAIALWQIEDALRSGVDNVAVYYDRSGLVPRERSAKLDIRRIPCAVRTGYFHPKVLLAVTEPVAKDSGDPNQLVALITSANLTQSGWWENVEIAHVECVDANEQSSFRDALLTLLSDVRRHAAKDADHGALEEIRRFVRGLKQRQHRSSGGVLHPQLFVGQDPCADWLGPLVPRNTDELFLEVISPFFDQTDAKPLRDLIDVIRPAQVRIFLPEAPDGAAACRKRFFEVVAGIPNVTWGRLPGSLLALGKGERVKQRMLHAKVYRLFDRRTKFEAVLVGSVNLTNAAHGPGGNLEAAFLVQTQTPRGLDWWLSSLEQPPLRFLETVEEEPQPQPEVRLSVRYDWAEGAALVYWDDPKPSGSLEVTAQGAPLFDLQDLPPRSWVGLPNDQGVKLRESLYHTSFLLIREEPTEYVVLVDESGMVRKPSVGHELSVADILKSWSLFSPEQRSAFIDARGSQLTETMRQLGMKVLGGSDEADSFFDLNAGIFLAFGNLERRITEAVSNGRDRELEYWLVGRQYDSLPTLLEQVNAEALGCADVPPVRTYLMLLCARQLLDTLQERHAIHLQAYQAGIEELRDTLRLLESVRAQFEFDSDEERRKFFDWFERWFLNRATPVEAS